MTAASALDLSSVKLGPKIITCTIEGIVEVEDIHELLVQAPLPQGALNNGGANGAAPVKQVQTVDDPADMSRVREKWHSVARLMASGMTQTLVASISGYSREYLSILLNNPAMQEMVEMYRMQHGSASAVIAEKLRTVGGKALEKLDERLDAGEITDTHELVGIAKLGFDRSGSGPTSTQHIVSEAHLVDHARLEELNQTARASSKERIMPLAARRALPAPEADEA